MFSVNPKGTASRPLFEALRRLDQSVQCERCFDWLFLPRADERARQEANVLSALINHCSRTKKRHVRKSECICTKIYADKSIHGISRRLEFDFYLPRWQVAIEYDERQHFTAERRLTLQFYNAKLFPFDVNRWSSLCSDGINDGDPPCRDWQRAFRDTVRDFRAREQGVKLIRLYYKDFNLTTLTKKGIIDSLATAVGT